MSCKAVRDISSGILDVVVSLVGATTYFRKDSNTRQAGECVMRGIVRWIGVRRLVVLMACCVAGLVARRLSCSVKASPLSWEQTRLRRLLEVRWWLR